MTVRFAAMNIPGTHGLVLQDSYESMTLRRFFFGQSGNTEKRGGRGGRKLSIRMVLHDNWSQHSDLEAFLVKLNNLINVNGTLTVTGDTGTSNEHCTLDSVEWIGTPLPGPLHGSTTDEGWWVEVMLHFWQLRGN